MLKELSHLYIPAVKRGNSTHLLDLFVVLSRERTLFFEM